MFIRKRKVKGHEYFALVESVRVEGKPRQRLIYNMGKRKTLEECIRAETKRLEYRIGLLDKTRPSPVYFRSRRGTAFRPEAEAEITAEYRERIEFLKDAAAKLGKTLPDDRKRPEGAGRINENERRRRSEKRAASGGCAGRWSILVE
jgi:hypothetical protein